MLFLFDHDPVIETGSLIFGFLKLAGSFIGWIEFKKLITCDLKAICLSRLLVIHRISFGSLFSFDVPLFFCLVKNIPLT